MKKKEIIKRLLEMADGWQKNAYNQVPPEYANRNMHGKYLRLDNEAAGVWWCGDELREFVESVKK